MINSLHRLSGRLLPLATFALALAVVRPAAAEDLAPATVDPGAVEVITELQDGLLYVMKHATELGFNGRVERLEGILEGAFDTTFMAQKSIGRHWKALAPEDQARWLSTFRRMTTATYADRFEEAGGKFETVGEEPASRGTVLVKTMLVLEDEDDVEINFRLRNTDVGWRIIDVYLNGTVSELALRIADYRGVLKAEGIEALIALVEDKTSKLAAAGAVQ